MCKLLTVANAEVAAVFLRPKSKCCALLAIPSKGVDSYFQVRDQSMQFRKSAHRVSGRLSHDDLTPKEGDHLQLRSRPKRRRFWLVNPSRRRSGRVPTINWPRSRAHGVVQGSIRSIGLGKSRSWLWLRGRGVFDAASRVRIRRGDAWKCGCSGNWVNR